ncbi:threonine-phosphate decarboxylase [Enterococcus sp. PF1-24]|uniref:threonine-phosphate decarboxylase CobD n=1 Tax=unclassified Enterococcus TaxID=2608891 RepID=UPI002475E8FB|nr:MULTISPECIES: threonine-phosphate decarboxylase CobD [unclassified Enterococcus]MDH6363391.1 threonine-phosphate decarboxylase [Enterococcus sp. PFB1-1]MDH6400308.1 threonine-phosphate decarboxylase [Enterococcus sp. PF1-24]
MKIKHGGNLQEIAEKYQVKQETLLDFSANINPLGMPSSLQQKLVTSIQKLAHYPDIRYRKLKEAIAKFHQLPQQDIYLGNGAAEVIFNLAQVLKLSQLLLLAPTFMEYEGAFRNYDTVFSYYLLAPHNFQVDVADLIAYAKKEKVTGICLCNPNNPTGQVIAKKDLLILLDFCRQKKISLIIDEAFIDFTPLEENSMISELANYQELFIIRSLTKMFAIPGLRLGYLLTSNQNILKQMEMITVPWHINTFAEIAGREVLKNPDFIKETQNYVKEEREFLVENLQKFKPILKVFPSEVNYLFLAYQGVTCLQERLLEKGVLVRKCDSFRGLSAGFYRIAVRSRVENMALLQALEEVLCEE